VSSLEGADEVLELARTREAAEAAAKAGARRGS